MTPDEALAELTAEAERLNIGYETRDESVGNWAKAILDHPFKQLLEILKRCRDLQIETRHLFNGGNPFVEYRICIGKRAYSGRTLGEAIGLALQEEERE